MIGAYIFRQALGDYARFSKIIVWLVVVAAVFGIAKVYHFVIPHQASRDAYAMMSSVIVFKILPLSAAILSMGVVAQEVEQKTIVYLLTRPIPRKQLLIFRTLAAALVVFVVTVIAACVTSFAFYGASYNEYLVRDIRALAFGSLAYTSAFVLVSLLVNRAMIVCLLFAFGWETLIPNISERMQYLSISSYVTSVSERPAGSVESGLEKVLTTILGSSMIPTQSAYIVLVAMIALALFGGAFWFERNEYIPREDAE